MEVGAVEWRKGVCKLGAPIGGLGVVKTGDGGSGQGCWRRRKGKERGILKVSDWGAGGAR